jgi:pimeloyl-ACP methyl ester carboxylesterase
VKHMPHARLVSFEECGHKPMFEYTALYNRTVRDFLRARKFEQAAAT